MNGMKRVNKERRIVTERARASERERERERERCKDTKGISFFLVLQNFYCWNDNLFWLSKAGTNIRCRDIFLI
jgi:hypothetical protein